MLWALVIVCLAAPVFAQANPQSEWAVHRDADVAYKYPKTWCVIQDGNPTIIADVKQIEYKEGRPSFVGEGLQAGRVLAKEESILEATRKIIAWLQRTEPSLVRLDSSETLIDGTPGLVSHLVNVEHDGHERETGTLQTVKIGDFVYYWWYIYPTSRSTNEETLRHLDGIFRSVHLSVSTTVPLGTVDIAQHALESLVIVESQLAKGTVSGSGFSVDSERVITNSHVCPPSASFIVVSFASKPGKKYRAAVLARDEKNDLLVLRVRGLNAKALHLSPREPKVGESIFVAGNPEGLEGSFSTGIVAAIRVFGHTKWIQITAPISPGSSGGPVMDDKGLVIGVTVANLKEGQNLNFAIPSAHVLNVLLAAK